MGCPTPPCGPACGGRGPSRFRPSLLGATPHRPTPALKAFGKPTHRPLGLHLLDDDHDPGLLPARPRPGCPGSLAGCAVGGCGVGEPRACLGDEVTHVGPSVPWPPNLRPQPSPTLHNNTLRALEGRGWERRGGGCGGVGEPPPERSRAEETPGSQPKGRRPRRSKARLSGKGYKVWLSTAKRSRRPAAEVPERVLPSRRPRGGAGRDGTGRPGWAPSGTRGVERGRPATSRTGPEATTEKGNSVPRLKSEKRGERRPASGFGQ